MTITLAPNLDRRRTVRLWARVLAALAASTPAWLVPLVVAMAFPVMKPGGKILFKNGLPVFGACTCCTGGGGGGAPCGGLGSNCVFCDETFAPLFYDAVASGVPVGECCHDAGTGNNIVPQDLNGAYRLSQFGGGCTWRNHVTTNPYVAPPPGQYGSTTCTGSPTQADDGTSGVEFYDTYLDLTRQAATTFQAELRVEMTIRSFGSHVVRQVRPFRGRDATIAPCNDAFSLANGTDTTAVCGSGTGTITFTPCTP